MQAVSRAYTCRLAYAVCLRLGVLGAVWKLDNNVSYRTAAHRWPSALLPWENHWPNSRHACIICSVTVLRVVVETQR